MNMVSQDTDTDVGVPYCSGAMDMWGTILLYCSRNRRVVYCMAVETGTQMGGYYTVLRMDIWYIIWF
jgi:hypothetical protein